MRDKLGDSTSVSVSVSDDPAEELRAGKVQEAPAPRTAPAISSQLLPSQPHELIPMLLLQVSSSIATEAPLDWLGRQLMELQEAGVLLQVSGKWWPRVAVR
jgi:hypothetical protein